jgi:hypothetical protein
MGKDMNKARLYLAAYFWPDDNDCISYAQSMGFGVILPNGSDLEIHVKAKGNWYLTILFIFEH